MRPIGRVSARPFGRFVVPVLVVLSSVSSRPADALDWSAVPLGTFEDVLRIQQESWTERWVVGSGGFAAHSDAARTTWTVVDVGTTADLPSVIEPGAGQAFVGGGGGVVRFQSGPNWLDRSVPSGQDFFLFSRNVGGAIAVGSLGGIYRTTDYGMSWTSLPSGTSAALHAGAGFVTGPAWAVGDGGTILKLDPGLSWAPRVSGTTADLHGFVETVTGVFAVGEGGTILKSVDGGQTWAAKAAPTSSTLRGISVAGNDFNVLFAAGDGGVVLRSSDQGETWCRLDTGTTADFRAIAAVTHLEVLVGGIGGVLLRTTNGGGGCLVSVGVEDELPASTLLAAPFPVPASDRVRFTLRPDRTQTVHVAVLDAAGRRVPGGADRLTLAPGRSTFDVEVGGLAPGVYFLRVSGDGVRESRRFVVVR